MLPLTFMTLTTPWTIRSSTFFKFRVEEMAFFSFLESVFAVASFETRFLDPSSLGDKLGELIRRERLSNIIHRPDLHGLHG